MAHVVAIRELAEHRVETIFLGRAQVCELRYLPIAMQIPSTYRERLANIGIVGVASRWRGFSQRCTRPHRCDHGHGPPRRCTHPIGSPTLRSIALREAVIHGSLWNRLKTKPSSSPLTSKRLLWKESRGTASEFAVIPEARCDS